ncbi:PepSY-associated TM helix domain-containing protein [Commensalibacter oyaizuii]|uniref:PepSY-associated TM helix domain-containing protein n=1 Tax=Commensalibacter oyaizuii TaxID=3043873 RepID=A0ABT6PZX8_9PROT|nr:PepSY-associated TM helix domain-containing protein [Commensalibacter sp. TBRC 16381]MDI2090056.1 PepSY-associated TM helix domain-containing protein [Commensalibacter sp. TBRC 16381]
MSETLLAFCKWNHRWIGLISGWFLFVILISGTISIFDKEITLWMQPELGQYRPSSNITTAALDHAYILWSQNKHVRKNLIVLPSDRDPFIRVIHHQGNLLQGSIIHPQSGKVIFTRATGGGYFIDSLHNNLFIGRETGGMIVLIISILFIFSIITGLCIYCVHYLKFVFIIQPKPTSPRFKFDLHTSIGLFFLPFLLIIAISGLLFLAPRYLPNTSTTHSRVNISQPNLQQPADNPGIIPNLYPLMNKAQEHFSSLPGTIAFTPKEIRFYEKDDRHIARLKNFIAFNKQNYEPSSSTQQISRPLFVKQTLLGIHTVRTGSVIIRILFFIMGLISAIFLAAGLLYYSNKKPNDASDALLPTRRFFNKLIEGVNMGIIMGTLISISSLFWINRLLPIHLDERIVWEINCFFITFLIIFVFSLLSALLNKIRFGWKSLILLLSSICLLLPIVEYITTYSLLKTALLNRNYIYITIDVIIFLFGLFFLTLYCHLNVKTTNKALIR